MLWASFFFPCSYPWVTSPSVAWAHDIFSYFAVVNCSVSSPARRRTLTSCRRTRACDRQHRCSVRSNNSLILWGLSCLPAVFTNVSVLSLLWFILILVTFSSSVSCFAVRKGGCQGQLYAEAHPVNRAAFSKGKFSLLRRDFSRVRPPFPQRE